MTRQAKLFIFLNKFLSLVTVINIFSLPVYICHVLFSESCCCWANWALFPSLGIAEESNSHRCVCITTWWPISSRQMRHPAAFWLPGYVRFSFIVLLILHNVWFCKFSGGQGCFCYSCAMLAAFRFLRDVWNRTQNAAVQYIHTWYMSDESPWLR
jgi:hypothetical protein